MSQKLSGGSNDYYRVYIAPTETTDGYWAECQDIIDALDMPFGLGNVFKACWRLARGYQGRGKPGNTATYDAEKIVHFGHREVTRAHLWDKLRMKG